MAFGIGAGGFIGIAHEVTAGLYVPPTKFFPFRSESLKLTQETIWRRPLRAIADVLGSIGGNSRVEGDVIMEAMDDVAPYFHYCSRATVVKTGAGPYNYVFTPSASATAPLRTMSICVVRDGIVFAYVGCVVGNFKYTIDKGELIATYTIIGMDEAVQTLPVAAFTGNAPYGAGQYNIQVPTTTQIFDVDTFDFDVSDNAVAEYRLQNVGRRAQFIRFGERAVKLTMPRDFQTRADFDAFKALTASTVSLIATKGAGNSFTFLLPNAQRSDWTVNLTGQGELLRATNVWEGVYDTTASYSYLATIITSESIV